MKKLLKKLTVLSLIVVVVSSFAGCSLFNKESNEKKQTQNAKNEKKEEPKSTEDKKNTEKLKKNKEVIDGKVYTQGEYAVATILIKDDISESAGKALAEEYAKNLKKEYKNSKVNVQAVQKGKNIANIVIDK